ncbi:MAG: hypothetical protein L6R40_007848 [Gallowayella cf. fulva]|nr:MAG: hypothetical protein L6R40_007848 [Xanthomendoza cf. fulva]
MEWGNWSGFVGDGTYVVINRSSLTALDARPSSSQTDSLIQGFAHCPYKWSQIWKIMKRSEGDVYVIKNAGENSVLTVTDLKEIVVDTPGPSSSSPIDLTEYRHQLWGIDKSMCALEEGHMVVYFRSIRNIRYLGSVLDLDRGDSKNGTAVSLRPGRRDNEHREPQKWLLQVQNMDKPHVDT